MPDPVSDSTRPAARRSDLALSLLLPVAVIALGVALSVGTEGVAAFVDLCLSALD